MLDGKNDEDGRLGRYDLRGRDVGRALISIWQGAMNPRQRSVESVRYRCTASTSLKRTKVHGCRDLLSSPCPCTFLPSFHLPLVSSMKYADLWEQVVRDQSSGLCSRCLLSIRCRTPIATETPDNLSHSADIHCASLLLSQSLAGTVEGHQHLSRTTAMPCPPPIHAAPNAHCLSSRIRLCVRLARILS